MVGLRPETLGDTMQIQIPHFRRRAGNGMDRHSEFIEMDGECIHKIENLDDFYKAFGYTEDIAKSGLLPEEFIWEEYIKGNALVFTECLQVHIIEYLRKHSDKFKHKYGEQAMNWIAAYAKTISSRGMSCAACRKNRVCTQH